MHVTTHLNYYYIMNVTILFLEVIEVEGGAGAVCRGRN